MIELYNEDCLKTMSRIEDGSVDLILQDPPYGTTDNEWDNVPDFDVMWKEWKRIIKPSGAIIMTANQPFTTDLIMSNRKDFRYCLVWDKMRTSASQLCNIRPLPCYEDIVLFLGGLPPVKVHCSNLGADALRKAIEKYNPKFDVRKELRGKYKRHYWPEDPFEAVATSKTKKHMIKNIIK